MKSEKPPIGAKPYYIQARERIQELSEAISRNARFPSGTDATHTDVLIKGWATEIICQIEMIEKVRRVKNERK